VPLTLAEWLQPLKISQTINWPGSGLQLDLALHREKDYCFHQAGIMAYMGHIGFHSQAKRGSSRRSRLDLKKKVLFEIFK